MTFSDEPPRIGRCGHRLWDDVDGVQCVNKDNHHGGHVYTSSEGSAVPDRHQEAS